MLSTTHSGKKKKNLTFLYQQIIICSFINVAQGKLGSKFKTKPTSGNLPTQPQDHKQITGKTKHPGQRQSKGISWGGCLTSWVF